MKKTSFCPIFKKREDLAKDNYMSINIMVDSSKAFETIIAGQLMEYFECIFDNMLCAFPKTIWHKAYIE